MMRMLGPPMPQADTEEPIYISDDETPPTGQSEADQQPMEEGTTGVPTASVPQLL